MKTIVVPLDGSEFAERALAPASALATRVGADILLVTSPIQGVLAEPEAYLEGAARVAGIDNPRTIVATDHGVVDAMVAIAADAADPVVCMTTHGHSGVGAALLGSTAEQIIRRVTVPLLLVGPSVERDIATRFDTVVVCTDGSEVSQAVVPVVAEWIRRLRLRTWIVQVLDPAVRRQLDQVGETVVEESSVYVVAQWLLHRDGAGVNWDVLHGDDVDGAIVDYASGVPASMIAMATHGRSGLARFALGSVAAAVVHRARCPVLVVRPDRLRQGDV